MKRSTGVIVAAIVAILGSVGTLLLGVVLLFAALMVSPVAMGEGVPAPPPNMAIILVVEAFVFCGLAIAGIACAVGLLKLKNWARIGFLVFGGILGGFSLMGILGSVMAAFLLSTMPLPPEVPPSFMTAFMAGVAVFFLALVGVSVWWLVYFTRRSVKEQFLSVAELSIPRRGPLSIKIIAWLLVVTGGVFSLSLFSPYPLLLFGIAFRGWTGKLLLVSFGLAAIAAGVGLLRWRPIAHALAMGIYGFFLLSSLVTLIMPGHLMQIFSEIEELNPEQADLLAMSESFARLSTVFAIVAIAIPLWFLVTRRRAFLEACKTPGQNTIVQPG